MVRRMATSMITSMVNKSLLLRQSLHSTFIQKRQKTQRELKTGLQQEFISQRELSRRATRAEIRNLYLSALQALSLKRYLRRVMPLPSKTTKRTVALMVKSVRLQTANMSAKK